MISPILLWGAMVVVVFAAASFISLRTYTRFAAAARGPDSVALPRGKTDTNLDRLFDPVEADHPGQQGLSNLLEARDAFAARSLATRAAGRSLDIITYIWATDRTGWLLIADLIAAADRGVRVRLLLDDVHVQGYDPVFLGMNMHPMIEVRLFNPIRNRGLMIRRAVEFLIGLSRFNRRIHSKVWIADGRLAILGGRNVGDVYFAAVGPDGQAATDADVVLAGSRVADVSAVFDSYWNLGLSLPILTLWPGFRMSMRGFRRRLARHVRSEASQQYLTETVTPHTARSLLVDRLRWTDRVEVLADPPEKAFGLRSGPWLSTRIATLMRQADRNVRLVTPYFVPGQAGIDLLADLRSKGVDVCLLTNSLATTDFALIHGAYTDYRKPLLALGIELHEFGQGSIGPGGRSFLHSKIFLFDDRLALIGSPNFDLRSANLNIEIGLLFEQADLVNELVAHFTRQTAPDASYKVQRVNGRLTWRIVRDGQSVITADEPGAGLRRLAAAGLMRMVPHAFF